MKHFKFKLSRCPLGILFIFLATILLIIILPFQLQAQGTWELVYENLGLWVRDLHFIDALEGWSVETGYINIFHTTDGGVTWEPQTDPVNEGNTAVYFIDSLRGFIGTSDANILHTVDGGETWVYFNNPYPDYTPLWAFDFLDDTLGYAVGGSIVMGYPNYNYYILKTVNGGESWDRIEHGFEGVPYDFAFANHDTGIVPLWEFDYPILRTFDGGETWEFTNINDSTIFYSIEHLYEGVFIACGKKMVGTDYTLALMKTTDYGSTWYDVMVDTIGSDVACDIDFVDSFYGMTIGGGEGDYYLTDDGGETWTFNFIEEGFSCLTLSYPVVYAAYACWEWDDIYRYTEPDLVPPAEISDLQISLDDEDVMLSWPEVSSDIFSNPITIDHYEIYRDENPYFQIQPQFIIGTTTDTTFIDSTVSMVLDEKYFYEIISLR